MTTELSYRRSSIAGASHIGLMIVLLDTLVGDLRRAAVALRKNDIETRCKELNHGTLVIGQLQSWVDLKTGGESAKILSTFYTQLRAKMIEAAGTKSATLLEEQVDKILQVRSAWQLLDATPPQAVEEAGESPAKRVNGAYPSTPEAMAERVPLSLSA